MALTISTELLHLLLDRWPVGRLATVSGDDLSSPLSLPRPHAVPIVFCRIGDLIYSPLDGKRKESGTLKRFANLDANPSASLLLDHYDDDWDRLWWVRIDGQARRLEADADLSRRLADRLRSKYPQYESVPLHFDGDVYLEMLISNVAAWSQSGTVAAIAEVSRTRALPRGGS